MSRVTDMSQMLSDAKSFNGDLSKWDVSKVTEMYDMFDNTAVFNGDLSKWDVSSIVDIARVTFPWFALPFTFMFKTSHSTCVAVCYVLFILFARLLCLLFCFDFFCS